MLESNMADILESKMAAISGFVSKYYWPSEIARNLN